MKKTFFLIALIALLVATSCGKHNVEGDVTTPSLNSISPSSGYFNDVAIIKGTNFSTTPSENKVTINGVEVKILNSTANSLTVRIPALTEGTWNIEVTTKNGNANNLTFTYNYTVYAAGYETLPSGVNVAKYWKNGKEILLTNGKESTKATSICLSDTDVYVSGSDTRAIYWKNQTPVYLTGTTSLAYAYSMLVHNEDVYVFGEEMNNIAMDVAKYWKNGVATSLTGDYANSCAYAGCLSENGDLYICGQQVMGNPAATIWKNGTLSTLTNGASSATSRSIALYNGNIYVAGNTTKGAGYWLNGSFISLTNDASWYSEAYAMCVVDGVAYVAGCQRSNTGYDVAKYWTKNGEIVLTDGADDAYATAITKIGNSIFVGGYAKKNRISKAVYWKDGKMNSLTTSVNESFVTSVFVI